MRISADGKFLASVSMDGTIKIWDAINLSLIRTINGIEQNVNTKVTICNDAKYVAVLQSKDFVVFDGKTGSEYWRREDIPYEGNGFATEWGMSNIISLYSDFILNNTGTSLLMSTGGAFSKWDVSNKIFFQ